MDLENLTTNKREGSSTYDHLKKAAEELITHQVSSRAAIESLESKLHDSEREKLSQRENIVRLQAEKSRLQCLVTDQEKALNKVVFDITETRSLSDAVDESLRLLQGKVVQEESDFLALKTQRSIMLHDIQELQQKLTEALQNSMDLRTACRQRDSAVSELRSLREAFSHSRELEEVLGGKLRACTDLGASLQAKVEQLKQNELTLNTELQVLRREQQSTTEMHSKSQSLLQEKITQLSCVNTMCADGIAHSDQVLSEARSKVSALHENLCLLEQELSDKTKKLEETSANTSRLTAAIQSLEELTLSQNHVISTAKGAIQTTLDNTQALIEFTGTIVREKLFLQDELNLAQSKVLDLQSAVSTLTSDLFTLRGQIVCSNKRNEDAEALYRQQTQTFQTKVNDLTAQTKLAEELRDRESKEVAVQKDCVSRLRDEVSRATTQIAAVQSELTDKTRHVETLEKSLAELEDKWNALRLEQQTLQRNYTTERQLLQEADQREKELVSRLGDILIQERGTRFELDCTRAAEDTAKAELERVLKQNSDLQEQWKSEQIKMTSQFQAEFQEEHQKHQVQMQLLEAQYKAATDSLTSEKEKLVNQITVAEQTIEQSKRDLSKEQDRTNEMHTHSTQLQEEMVLLTQQHALQLSTLKQQLSTKLETASHETRLAQQAQEYAQRRCTELESALNTATQKLASTSASASAAAAAAAAAVAASPPSHAVDLPTSPPHVTHYEEDNASESPPETQRVEDSVSCTSKAVQTKSQEVQVQVQVHSIQSASQRKPHKRHSLPPAPLPTQVPEPRPKRKSVRPERFSPHRSPSPLYTPDKTKVFKRRRKQPMEALSVIQPTNPLALSNLLDEGAPANRT
ncbi:hypothetical protein Pelo_12702 [Pelomyxa schiedti]|nr:hypothetical protein Pelo_12702 [Pelomyxa schiedti]